jgi:hypothetical protein
VTLAVGAAASPASVQDRVVVDEPEREMMQDATKVLGRT